MPHPFSATLCTCLLFAAPLGAATLTVTTTNNASTAADGVLSLKEAIEQVGNGDTIAFAIPGDGPHYIETPETGYPLLDNTGVIIDGYSQAGSQRNTGALTEPHTTVLKIVIDSRNGGRYSLAEYGDNGFGDSESAIFPLFYAADCRIQGLAFIGVPGDDSSESPFIYDVALIGASTNVRVQGCWFGLDPGAAPFPTDNDGLTPGVFGARAAVASFQWDNDTTSAGLILGTDGDGVGDRGEFNIMVGNLLAIHLQTPDSRISGNYINVLPDGRLWDPAVGLPGIDVECYENGRGDGNIIGTNSDGISDTDESNVIGPVVYGVYFEFWRPAVDVVMAGNFIGSGPRGETPFATPAGTALVEMRKDSSLRIGSDMNGVADAVEANRLSGFEGEFLAFHGSNNEAEVEPVRVALRGNLLSRNYGDLPVSAQMSSLSLERYFFKVLADPLNDYRPFIDATSTPALIKGRVPAPAVVEVNHTITIDVDFYLADPWGLQHSDPIYPDGYPQGLVYLGTKRVDGAQDTDPVVGSFAFAGIPGVTAESMNRLICAAHYVGVESVAGVESVEFASTTMFSFPPAGATMSLDVQPLVGGNISLSWLGGTGPFLVQHSVGLGTGAWNDLVTTASRLLTLPMAGPEGFFRVQDRSSKVVKLFTANLSGAAERPTPVVSTGTGRGYLSIEAAAQKGSYYLAYENLVGDASDAHIHGPADVNAFAGVLVGLTPPTGRAGVLSGLIQPASADFMNAVNAGNTYFNIHTTFATPGEIRGQLSPFTP